MSGDELDLGLGVLDHQLVDSEGRNCGNADELEISGIASGEPEVTEILVGGNALAQPRAVRAARGGACRAMRCTCRGARSTRSTRS